jgi:hypothetical protein
VKERDNLTKSIKIKNAGIPHQKMILEKQAVIYSSYDFEKNPTVLISFIGHRTNFINKLLYRQFLLLQKIPIT